MPRRWLSLLALLLLVLSAQAAADGDDDGGDDDDRDDEGDGRDGGKDRKRKEKEKDRDHDGRYEDREEDDEDDRGHGGDRKGKAGKGKAPWQASLPGWPPDASLRIVPAALPGRIQFSFLVAGGPSSEPVTLSAGLPEAGGEWTLAGPDASACELRGQRLACSFDGVGAGGPRLVEATAPIGRAPPWELVAEGAVALGGGGDAVPGNDAAAGRIGLLLA